MNTKVFYGVLSAVGASILPIILNYLIKRKYREKIKKLELITKEPDHDYYHCMFWTSENEKCRAHIISYTDCGSDCSATHLQTILKLLASAKLSISLCMYYVTLNQIAEELVLAKQRGVVVRIITDDVTFKMKSSKCRLLQNCYQIEVRSPCVLNTFMHHKFAVIDAEDENLRKMFFGSLNLTLQGCAANFEYVVITNNERMISSYNDEFEALWSSFEGGNEAHTI